MGPDARRRALGAVVAAALVAAAARLLAVTPDAPTMTSWLAAACAYLALATALPSSGRVASWTVALGGAALAVGSAWPLLDAAFLSDAPVLRAAYAGVDVRGDWNHPFLSYALLRPVVRASLDPRVLRALPVAYAVAETALAALAARIAGGPFAGALAGAWFAAELRRRHGIPDLGDWDLAGVFLCALLLWASRRDDGTSRDRPAWRAVVVVALLAGGVASSWLMVVPAAVMAGCLALDAASNRARRLSAAVTAAVVAALAVPVLQVFMTGHHGVEPGHAKDLGRAMLVESPLGRTPLFALPALLGLADLVARPSTLARRFALGTLLAVPAAVAVAYRWSHVNGGYYAGLATPVLCVAAAVPSARAFDAWMRSLDPSAAPPFAAHLGVARRAVAAVLVALVTARGVAAPEAAPHGILGPFAARVAASRRPVLTNAGSLARLVAFERSRAGAAPLAEVLAPPSELERRIVLLDPSTCAPRAPVPPGDDGFDVALLRIDDATAARACRARWDARCRDLGPPHADPQPPIRFLACDGSPDR